MDGDQDVNMTPQKFDVMVRLEWMTKYPPALEGSWYGPVLTAMERSFKESYGQMIKPQGLLRKYWGEMNEDGEVSDASLDSNGAPVKPRNIPGNETGIMIPDFMVVLGVNKPRPSRRAILAGKDRGIGFDDGTEDNTGGDRTFLVVEVKRDGESLLEASNQLKGYLKRALEKQKEDQVILGVLVIGSRIWAMAARLSLNHRTQRLLIEEHKELADIDITDRRLLGFLEKASGDYRSDEQE